MKIRKLFTYCFILLLFSSCESGFEDMMKETKGEKAYKYYAYVANYDAASISVYSINSNNGVLTKISDYSTSPWPARIAADPEGRFLYVARDESGNNYNFLSVYKINSDGSLTYINEYMYTQRYTDTVTVHPNGKFVYVNCMMAGGTAGSPGDSYTYIRVYSVDSTGMLTYISEYKTASIGDFTYMKSLAIDPTGKFAYAPAEVTNRIYAFSINTTTGELSYINTYSFSAPNSITVDSAGRFVYAKNNGSINIYAIDSGTGELGTPVNTVYTGSGNIWGTVKVDSTGCFMYIADSGLSSQGYIYAYAVNSITGALTYINTLTAGAGSISLSIEPANKYVYVSNYNNDTVSAYSISSTTGNLTEISGSPFVAAGSGKTWSMVTVKIAE